MTTEKRPESASQLDEGVRGIRGELVRWVAAADRNANREIYDALEYD